jgi:hypothetical protein
LEHWRYLDQPLGAEDTGRSGDGSADRMQDVRIKEEKTLQRSGNTKPSFLVRLKMLGGLSRRG